MGAKKGVTQYCDKCKREIGTYAFNRHYEKCNSVFTTSRKYEQVGDKAKCPECGLLFSRNGVQSHYRIVHEKRTSNKPIWNKGLSKETNEIVKKIGLTIKEKYALGLIPPNGVTSMSKEERSRLAKLHNFGGYREKAGRAKKSYVLDSFGKTVCLQSSFELICANILDALNIKWVRPSHLKYDNRRYYPDFLLVDYQIYLDPKNSYKAKLDQEKIQKVSEQNNVKVYVLLQQHLTKEYILEIINGRVA